MKTRIDTSSRRSVLKTALSISGCAVLARLGLPLSAATISALGHAQSPTTPDAGMQIILLGTQGGPNFNAIRAESANAVVVDGHIYMVDCGYSALLALYKSGLSYREVGKIFLTHLHDDHTADLAALLSHQWSGGRVDPTMVIGPYGTQDLVGAAIEVAAANTAIRLIDEDRSVRPESLFNGRDIAAPAAPTEIFSDERLRVFAVENTHFPAYALERMPYRSVSYRFDASDRSVAFSGDTAFSEALIELATGADVLVCEAIEVASMRRAFEQMVANGAYADNAEGVWEHIVATHASTEDAGRMASAAGVPTLVLTHLAPGALIDIEDTVYIEGARRHFDGEIIVAHDLLTI